MSDEIIDKLVTNSYKILKVLYDNQTRLTDGSVFTPMTQVEIAKQLGVSKITMNALFKELQQYDLVIPYGSGRGRYCLSDKALLIIKQIDDLDEKLRGEQ